MIDEQSSASGHDYASDRSAIGAGFDDHQLEWVCKHLGHTCDIHNLYYRPASGTIERINLGKLMIIQDKDLVGKFANRKLEDIQFNGK